MKRTVFFLWMLLFTAMTYAQDFHVAFADAFRKKDTAAQYQTLVKWEAANPKDPELFIGWFNYYLSKARKEAFFLSKETPTGERLELAAKKGSTVGNFGQGETTYDVRNTEKALLKIKEGIALFPDRLDMRFGKIYAYGLTEDWKNFTSDILATIEYSKINKNNWRWTGNVKKDDPEKFFLTAIHSYQFQLYETEDDALIPYLRDIASAVLKYYPNNVESLSNLAISYMILKEPKKAIEPLLKAEKINPKDVIVLNNLAHAYHITGNTEKAMVYYKKVVALSEGEDLKFAQAKLLELQKKN